MCVALAQKIICCHKFSTLRKGDGANFARHLKSNHVRGRARCALEILKAEGSAWTSAENRFPLCV